MASSSSDKASSSLKQVDVRPGAFCSMILHAVQHKTQAVHGVLLGSSTATKITVEQAVPVCHNTPTLPLVETALGLIEVMDEKVRIVGWYSAPLLMEDTQPPPVAMRMTSSLETSEDKPCTLLVLNNAALGPCVKGNSSKAKEAVQAYGKDFGKQFQEAVKTVVDEADGACQALKDAVADEQVSCLDLQDNMMEPASIWYPNKPLIQLVDAACKGTI